MPALQQCRRYGSSTLGIARHPTPSAAPRPAQEELSEERGSSAEEGSDDEEGRDEGSDEEEGSGSEDESPTARRRPRKKHKPFVAPPPRELPQRTTRGARMGSAVAEEGDEEFWVSGEGPWRGCGVFGSSMLCRQPTATKHIGLSERNRIELMSVHLSLPALAEPRVLPG